VVVRYTEPAVIAITKSDMPQKREPRDVSPRQNEQSQDWPPQPSEQEQSQSPQQVPQASEPQQRQQPHAPQQSSGRSRTQGNTGQEEPQLKATITGAVAGVDRDAGVLVVHSDKGDELVMRAPDSDALSELDEGDRVLVTYTEAAIVGIQPVQDSQQRLQAPQRNGPSTDEEDSDEDSEDGTSGNEPQNR